MNPLISVSAYCIGVALILYLSWNCGKEAACAVPALKGILLAGMAVFILLSALPVMGTFLPNGRLKYLAQGAGNIWLGFLICYSGSLPLLKLIAMILRPILHRSRDNGGLILAGGLVIGGIAFAYGMIHSQHTIITHYDLTLPGKESEADSLRVALIADLHLSVNSHPEMMERMVKMINEQEPDVVVVAGDIFTSSYEAVGDPGRYAAILRGIRAKEGVYAIYGNHDVEEGLFCGFPVTPISMAFRSFEMEEFCRESGFTVLEDETVTLAGGRIQLAGRIDGEKAGDGTKKRKSAGELLADTDPGLPVIVMEHEPKDYKALAGAGADLVLSGHTHDGQIFPGNLVVPFFNENAYGRKVIDGMTTIVTSGIGYYGPPMRIGTDSEIMILDIIFE